MRRCPPPGTNVDRDAAHVWPLCTRSAATSCRWRGELDTEDTLRIYFLAFYVISLTVCLVKVVPASLKVPTPERRAKPPIWVLVYRTRFLGHQGRLTEIRGDRPVRDARRAG